MRWFIAANSTATTDMGQPNTPELPPPQDAKRRMVRAELMGSHTHRAINGIEVHVWIRDGKFIARGRYDRRQFGKSLGSKEVEAISRLRKILTDLEAGAFVAPREENKRQLSIGIIPRLTFRQLISEFLAIKRKLKGKNTANDYCARLNHVLDFAELPKNLKRWPLAANCNAEFAIELRVFLHQRSTTRNGRSGGAPKTLSARQIRNVLECVRSVISWAQRADVRKLPVQFANPFSVDLIGKRPSKDPLRDDPIPLARRIELVHLMDRWQLCNLTISLLLPVRPEEAAGILISDVNFDKSWFEIGTRLGGADYTKESTSFKLPFPHELRPILRACIGQRLEGPLLRSRKAFEKFTAPPLASRNHLEELIAATNAKAAPETICSEQDRKALFRRLLCKLGGISEDQLGCEYKKLFRELSLGGCYLYLLRSSVTTSMREAKVPMLEMRYLTSHSVSDILNTYTNLDPVGAMNLYFDQVRPLLEAITHRAIELGIAPSPIELAPDEGACLEKPVCQPHIPVDASRRGD